MAIALKSNALIDQEELEKLTGLTGLDSDIRNALINVASDFIEKYCDRKFISQLYTDEKYDSTGTYELYLKNYPISSVTVKSWDIYNNVLLYTFTEHSDYTVYTEEGYIYKYGGWAKGHKRYAISYTAGYVIADVPFDLKLACAKICHLVYDNKGKEGVSAETIGRYAITYGKAWAKIGGASLPPDITNLLNKHKRYSTG